MNKVRTRFAPSPTGDLHVGGARTALFNWLFSRSEGGDFVLRIEDTDFDRSADKHTEQILKAMNWLGLDWDEGPEIGGPHAPYHQSQRIERYKEVVDKLIEKGVVYRCYCTKEELQQQRERQMARREPTRYNGRCRDISDEQRQQFEAEGRKFTYRYKIPEESVVVHDIVKGDVEFPPDQVGDFIIVKSNGTPSYNFAVVVDDHDMEISHVIRGDDHLSNTPRQLYIYNELDWESPQWCHLAMILGSDGERLSKRHGATDVYEYREKGFLPEAMINGLVLLGWSPPDGVEVKSVQEIIDSFDLGRVNKSASRFDKDKLTHLNGKHLRSFEIDELIERLEGFMPEDMEPQDKKNLPQILEVFSEQLEMLPDFSELYEQFFQGTFEIDSDALEWLEQKEDYRRVVETLRDKVEQSAELEAAAVKAIIKEVSEETGVGGKGLYMPMRIATTGRQQGPEFQELMPLLGKERCLLRIDAVIAALKAA